MYKYLFAYSILISSLFAVSQSIAKAKDFRYTVKEVPNVHIEDTTQFVTDPDKMLAPIYRDSINLAMKYMRASLNTEARAVLLPCISPNEPIAFAQSIFDSWEIEKTDHHNYGILIFFVFGDEGIYLYMITGKKMEKVLLQEHLQVMQLVTMVPTIKEEGLSEGIYAGVKEIIRMLEDFDKEKTHFKKENYPNVYISLLLLVFLLAFLLKKIKFYK